MKTPLEQLMFESDDMPLETIQELLSTMKVQKKRWLGGFHPDSRVRAEAFRASGVCVGKEVFLSIGTVILDSYQKGLVSIGARSAFGNYVSLVAASGPNESSLKYHLQVQKNITTAPITIGEDCWIGTGVTVLPNVSIGNMSIIGAGAVVDRNVPPYSVYAGIPARLVRNLDQEYVDVRT